MRKRMKFPVSYSRLSTFEACPRKFEYIHVDRTISDPPNTYSEYGTRVHESLEKYGRTGDGGHLTDETREFKQVVDTLKNLPGDKYWEHQMAVTADLTPCGWFSEDTWMRCVADLLIISGDRAVCIDWKTGKVKDDETQLMLFAAMILWQFPEVSEVSTAFVWLKHKAVTRNQFHRNALPLEWAPLASRFDKVQQAVDLGVYDPKPSYACRWCPANKVCSYAQ